MIILYEKACREAGLSEEKTAELRRFFDADKKRLKYWKEMRMRHHMNQGSLEDYLAENPEKEPISKDDVEEEAFLEMNLKKLREYMQDLDEEDRIFLLRCFDGTSEREHAESLGITRAKLRRKRDFMIAQLRKKFGTEN